MAYTEDAEFIDRDYVTIVPRPTPTKGKRPAGPFLHIEHMEWLLKDFTNDDRYAWLFAKENRPYMQKAGIALMVAYLIFGSAGQLISNLVGFTYPAYHSIRALESSSKEDDTRWLTYWVVFSVFTLADSFSSFLLSWIPLYWLVKVVVLVWTFYFNGSAIIYKKVILPFFKKHEKKIDSAMGKMESTVKKVASGAAEKITETARVEL